MRTHLLRPSLVVICALLGASAAQANPSMASVLGYPGLWPVVAIAIVVMIEAVILRLFTRWYWLAVIVTVLLANLFSALFAGGLGGPVSWNLVSTLTLLSIVLEMPIVLLACALAARRAPRMPSRPQPLAWAILAVIAMNVASAPIIPGFQMLLPAKSMYKRYLATAMCSENLKQLGRAVRAYQEEHGTWPPARDIAELAPLLAPYHAGPKSFECPGGVGEGRLFPLPQGTTPYVCIDFTRLPESPTNAGEIPVVWDPAPRHGGNDLRPEHPNEGYNVLYLDGHVKWSAEVPRPPVGGP